jgi:hypothetical protein
MNFACFTRNYLITFVYCPIFPSGVTVGETIDAFDATWNYKLDGTWQLGQKPFMTAQYLGVIKTPEQTSVTPAALGAVLNGSVVITAFIRKDSDASSAIVEYETPKAVGSVSRVALMDAGGQTLFASALSAPIPVAADSLIIRHIIAFSEVTAQ